MGYITLTKDEFETLLPVNFETVEDGFSKEYVYQVDTKNVDIDVRIYSTVDVRTGVTRDIGTDAIRIIFWDTKNGRPIGKGRKILRVEGATTIQERIQARIAEFMITAHDQEVVDFKYVEAILSSNAVNWSDFTKSLLEQLQNSGFLSNKQLAYVLGDPDREDGMNPKGRETFEMKAKTDDPKFFETFLNELEADDGEKKGTEKKEPKGKKDLNYNEEPYRTKTTKAVKVNETTAEPIPTNEYPDWQYPFENFNPVQSMVMPHKEEDINMVISANTSAGKTICAELIMDDVLKNKKRVIYLSPLKSLTQEKYDDWQKRFPNHNITILTGDYTLSDEMKKRLVDSQIIVMTSEMADSRTRRMRQEKNFWLMAVGLVIVDESHILTTNRGHAVETGLMRFTKINPKARIVFLSATMPNVGELGEWLTVLNGKETKVLYNTWRPVELQMHYEEYMPVMRETYSGSRMNYAATQKVKRDRAISLVESKPDEKFLVFVHDKNTGRALVKELKKNGIQSVFHNADLDIKDRLETERSFQDRDNGIRVLVSTSTLAWGRNLPARNVIVVGIHRGIQDVDELDIIQMAGRAGRFGIDDEGHVYLIIPSGSTSFWMETFKNPRPVTSVLNDHEILAFHTLAEVETKEIKNGVSMLAWYKRSLAYKQNIEFTDVDATGLFKDLEEMEMVQYREDRQYCFITALGRVSAWLYFSPYDVFAWYKNFGRLFMKVDDQGLVAVPTNVKFEAIPEPIEEDDLTIAWALGDIPSNDLGYVPKDLDQDCSELLWKLKNRGVSCGTTINTVLGYYSALSGMDDKEMSGGLRAVQRGVKYDIRRVTQALKLIDSMYSKWDRENLWEILPDRIVYGVPAEMAELVRLPGVGAVRAAKMWRHGLHSVADVADPENKKKLRKAIASPTLIKKVVEAARAT